MSYQPPYQQQQQPPSYSHYAYASPQMVVERPHGKLGIVSFVMALVTGLGEFVLIAIAGVMESSTPGGMDENSPKAMVLGLLLLFGLLLAVLGAILGIAGMFDSAKKRVFAVIGLCLNGLIVLLGIGMLVLGLAMG
jgi:hypothetical protein